MAGKSRFTVRITQASISIRYDGREVLFWHMDEWREDPAVAIAAMEAMRLTYEQPSDLYDRLVKLDKLP